MADGRLETVEHGLGRRLQVGQLVAPADVHLGTQVALGDLAGAGQQRQYRMGDAAGEQGGDQDGQDDGQDDDYPGHGQAAAELLASDDRGLLGPALVDAKQLLDGRLQGVGQRHRDLVDIVGGLLGGIGLGGADHHRQLVEVVPGATLDLLVGGLFLGAGYQRLIAFDGLDQGGLQGVQLVQRRGLLAVSFSGVVQGLQAHAQGAGFDFRGLADAGQPVGLQIQRGVMNLSHLPQCQPPQADQEYTNGAEAQQRPGSQLQVSYHHGGTLQVGVIQPGLCRLLVALDITLTPK